MIESYSFGRIKIKGKLYTKDVIIRLDSVQGSWWRNEGHQLAVDDIREVVEKDKPSALVVGTGKFGVMKVLPATAAFLEQNGVRLLAQKTEDACKTFNKLIGTEKVVGAFHLTC